MPINSIKFCLKLKFNYDGKINFKKLKIYNEFKNIKIETN